MSKLKADVERLAQDENKPVLEIITLLQTVATLICDWDVLDELCMLKWEYI